MNFPINNLRMNKGNSVKNTTGSIPQFTMSPVAVVRLPNVNEPGVPYCTLGCPCCIDFMVHNKRCACSKNKEFVHSSTQTTADSGTQTGEDLCEPDVHKMIFPRNPAKSIAIQTEDEIGTCAVDCDEEAFFTSGTTAHRLLQQEINHLVQKFNITTIKERKVQKAVSELFSIFPNLQNTDENFKRIKHRMRKMLNSKRYYDRLKEAAEEEGIPVKYMRQYKKANLEQEQANKELPVYGKYSQIEEDSDSDNTIDTPVSSGRQTTPSETDLGNLHVQDAFGQPMQVYIKQEESTD